ncbi:hypothetical protein Taro_044560 [Colocasia esculenta]|uniref:Uncharacterized protein n=1 Tax=Colocasia esculenta TaxID=4460 RepID=A0A843X123_COLES|nr:hypothetical protein [Colocasia esculenta]
MRTEDLLRSRQAYPSRWAWCRDALPGCVHAIAMPLSTAFSTEREKCGWTFFLSSGRPGDKSSSLTDAWELHSSIYIIF